METLDCKWSSLFEYPFVCIKEFYYENKSSPKWAGICTLISMNITFPQQQSCQTLQVEGFWESNLLIHTPPIPLLPNSLLWVLLGPPKKKTKKKEPPGQEQVGRGKQNEQLLVANALNHHFFT